MKIRTIFKVTLPIGVLIVGISAANYLISTRPKAELNQPAEPVTLVAVHQAVPAIEALTISGAGTVVPARTVVIQPEVSGRVVSMNPALVRGGRLSAGDALITIDDRDYKLQVSQQSAQVASTKAQLRIEKGRKRVAQREWKLLGKDSDASDEGRSLALREPQVAAARAAVRAAQVATQRARLLQSKTELTVPFNAVVDSEAVELDQLVGPNSRLATLIGTDQYWVEVALPLDKLQWITIPGVNTTQALGSAATVRLDTGKGTLLKRRGHVVRLKPSIDAVGRMARVVVAIDNPLGIQPDGTTEGLPLLTNAYVKVDIQGAELPNVVELPRLALREGSQVWLMGADNRLVVRDVRVRWRLHDRVLISGVARGDKIITSLVPSMVPNMLLAVDDSAPTKNTARVDSDDSGQDEVAQ